jgi:hypothetical protein
MILLLSPYQNAKDCAALIKRATQEDVKHVETIRLALAALRNQEFTTVVADENLLECRPGSADALVQRMQSAVPIFLDMACMRPERVSKFVELALRRREIEYKTARELAAAELKSELKSEVTGLLISSEIALKAANLPPQLNANLSSMLETAKRIKMKLEK